MSESRHLRRYVALFHVQTTTLTELSVLSSDTHKPHKASIVDPLPTRSPLVELTPLRSQWRLQCVWLPQPGTDCSGRSKTLRPGRCVAIVAQLEPVCPARTKKSLVSDATAFPRYLGRRVYLSRLSGVLAEKLRTGTSGGNKGFMLRSHRRNGTLSAGPQSLR